MVLVSQTRTASSSYTPSPCCTDLPEAALGLSQHPDIMLAMMVGHRGEFVKNTAPVLSGKRLVAIPYCCQQLLLPHSAYASSQAIRSQFFGIILLRECSLGNAVYMRLPALSPHQPIDRQ